MLHDLCSTWIFSCSFKRSLKIYWAEEGIIFYRKKSPSTADYFLGLRRLHLQWPPPLLEKIGRNEENYKNWLWLNPITTLHSLRQLPTACKGVLNCPGDTFKKIMKKKIFLHIVNEDDQYGPPSRFEMFECVGQLGKWHNGGLILWHYINLCGCWCI